MSDSEYDLDELNNEPNIGLYEGERNEIGERHGHGRADYHNGDIYNGNYSEGKRNGMGSYTFKNAQYVGEYKDGKREGEGRMQYPDASVYHGHWVNGERCGLGVYSYRNGDTYDGEWKDDRKHGKGTYTYQDTKTQLKGIWVEGVREGSAEWINKGYLFRGYFRNEHPFGLGKFIFDNGCEQHGFYKVTNLVEQVDKVMEVVGRETRWTCTSLVQTPRN